MMAGAAYVLLNVLMVHGLDVQFPTGALVAWARSGEFSKMNEEMSLADRLELMALLHPNRPAIVAGNEIWSVRPARRGHGASARLRASTAASLSATVWSCFSIKGRSPGQRCPQSGAAARLPYRSAPLSHQRGCDACSTTPRRV